MPITELSQLNPEKTYTYADYLTWRLRERVELIRGRLFPLSPAPNTTHQRIVRELTTPFTLHFRQHACQVFPVPFDVRLPVPRGAKDVTVVQPDLCVICDEAKLDEQGCNGAPDLVVEILSPGNSRKEMREKFSAYEEAGVREYWLVHPQDRTVLVYVLNEDGHYIGRQPVTEPDPVRATCFPELAVDLSLIFDA